jgi:hypothetical protein
MTEDKVLNMSRALLKRVGVEGWEVQIVDEIDVDSDVPVEWRFGVAIFSTKTILFQRVAVTRENDSVVHELIAHEVCHAWWGNTAEDHPPDCLVEVKAFRRLMEKEKENGICKAN